MMKRGMPTRSGIGSIMYWKLPVLEEAWIAKADDEDLGRAACN